MTDISPEKMNDDELLSEINRYDPYDVEFARRFRSLSARVAQLEAERGKFRAVLEGAEYRSLDEITSVEHGMALGEEAKQVTIQWIKRAKNAETRLTETAIMIENCLADKGFSGTWAGLFAEQLEILKGQRDE